MSSQILPILSLAETLANLPPETDTSADIQNQITQTLRGAPLLIILDDDPTGTQTCHDVIVLTVWDVPTLVEEFRNAATCSKTRGFFVLTNSRALPPREAGKLIRTICLNVAEAARATSREFEVVLRGDSTLRGHFPLELEVAESVFGEVDAWILAPFFFQGGRYTIDDVHYVTEGDTLVPAGMSPFAQDATFGYRSSNLKAYIEEKAPGRFSAEQMVSVSIGDLRCCGPRLVQQILMHLPKGTIVVVNAAAESDMRVFVAGLLQAESEGKRFIYRTGAAFVSTRLGITPQAPINVITSIAPQGVNNIPESQQNGALIIAGSYVPKTTAQLKTLIDRRGDKLMVLEIDVQDLISSPEKAATVVNAIAHQTDKNLAAGKDTLVMTSRNLVTGSDALSSLAIGSLVANALVQILQQTQVRPRYIIAKGGITSSDAATKGLNMKRATVVGQAAAGVPLWRCDEATSRYRGVPYVVFPGNVGSESTLADLVKRWG